MRQSRNGAQERLADSILRCQQSNDERDDGNISAKQSRSDNQQLLSRLGGDIHGEDDQFDSAETSLYVQPIIEILYAG